MKRTNVFRKLCKYSIIVCVLMLSLTGCGGKEQKENLENREEEQEERISYPVKICFRNYDDKIKEEELVTFYSDDGEIYNGIGIEKDGEAEANLFVDECNLVSHTLDKKVKLPKTDENHIWRIEIDYDTGDISASLEETGK